MPLKHEPALRLWLATLLYFNAADAEEQLQWRSQLSEPVMSV